MNGHSKPSLNVFLTPGFLLFITFACAAGGSSSMRTETMLVPLDIRKCPLEVFSVVNGLAKTYAWIERHADWREREYDVLGEQLRADSPKLGTRATLLELG